MTEDPISKERSRYSSSDLREMRMAAEKKRLQDLREPAERDYDRITSCSALRRLGGVGQVVAPREGHTYHSRLTHTLRVSRLARRVAQKLLRETPEMAAAVGGINPDVVEAAGLTHDLGYPPFGYVAEVTLRECVEEAGDPDAFEGNAQSFRVATKLALVFPQFSGLNLTRATLNAFLKYPWSRQPDVPLKMKYSFYHSEENEFHFARELHSAGDPRRSAEAEIMVWADDVTYALYDAEDFFRAGLIPLERLASVRDDSERRRFFDGMYERPGTRKHMGDEPRAELEEIFQRVVTPFPISEPFANTREQEARLRYFSSMLFSRFIGAIELHSPAAYDHSFVRISRRQSLEVKLLKALTWFYVINNQGLAAQQFGQRKMIRELFEIFVDAAMSPRDEETSIIPSQFLHAVRSAERNRPAVARLVADMIASMTEEGLTEFYGRVMLGDKWSNQVTSPHALGRARTYLEQQRQEDEAVRRLRPSETEKSLRAFLCHATEDKPVVRELYRKLKENGVEPWLDEEDLVGGSNWKYEISKALGLTHVVIICLSSKSVTKAGYVQTEIKKVLDLALQQPEGAIFLIPLRLENSRVPDQLCEWQRVDLFEAKGFEKLMRALRKRAHDLELS